MAPLLLKTPKKFHLYHYAMQAPRAILVFCLLTTLASFFLAGKLGIVDLYSGLLPKGAQSVDNLWFAEEHFGELGFLVLVIEGGDPVKTEKFSRILAQEIKQHPDVYYVRAPWDFDFFKEKKWLYVDLKDLADINKRLEQALSLQEQGVNFVFSHLMDFADRENLPDLDLWDIQNKYKKRWGAYLKFDEQKGGATFLWVKTKGLKKGLEDKKHFVASIQELESRLRKTLPDFKDVTVGTTGSYQTSIETVAATKREITLISSIALVCLLGTLIAYFRKWRLLLYVGGPLFVGIAWTGGFAYLVLGQLNLLTGFAATILAGLGSDYAIYLLTRFEQERAQKKDLQTACQLAFAGTGRATYLSMLVTLTAFVGLCFSDLNVLFEFGLIGAFGLLMTYIATMLVMPALMMLFEKKEASKKDVSSRWLPHSVHSAFSKKLFFPLKGYSIVGFTLLMIMGCLLTPAQQFKIQFVEDLSTAKIPSNQLYDKVSASIGATLNPTLLITRSSDENNKLSLDIRETLKTRSPEELVYNNIIDYSQLIPRFQKEKKQLLKNILENYQKINSPLTNQRRRLFQELTNAVEAPWVGEEDIPEKVKKFFLSPENPSLYAAYLFPAFPRVSADAMKRYQKGVVTDLKQGTAVDFIAVDGSFLASDAVTLMQQKMPVALFLFFLFLAIILLVMIRPALVAFLSFAHLLAAVVIVSGVMYFFGISYNILNVVCLPIVLGTGIDIFVHYSYRLAETGSLWEAIREEVSPMGMSCLTTMIGFGGLLFTSNRGLRSVGWVAVIGVTVIFVLGAFVYPRVYGIIRQLKF